MSEVLTQIAGELVKRGAPTLGGMIGTAIGGPAGAAIGGIAGKGIEMLAEALGAPADDHEAVKEAVTKAAPGEIVELEQTAKVMAPILLAEAQRIAAQEATEMSKGFSSWQFWKGVIQAVVWSGWLAILSTALVGGNLGVKPLMPLTDLVTTWGSVTLVWMAVYNGGHTVKEMVSSGAFRFGKR